MISTKPYHLGGVINNKKKGRIMSLAPLFAELACNPNNGIEQLLLKDNLDPRVHPINALRRDRRHKIRYTPYKPLLRHASLNHENKSVPPLGKDRFQMSIDMLEFKLNKLGVKVVDQTVTVEEKYGLWTNQQLSHPVPLSKNSQNTLNFGKDLD
uniref:Uncharacterized protein n=1 Tax=Glossina austeni TaxID=7395 RepID=A0A1A9UF34_GLOAU